jgi:hypothetical protein
MRQPASNSLPSDYILLSISNSENSQNPTREVTFSTNSLNELGGLEPQPNIKDYQHLPFTVPVFVHQSPLSFPRSPLPFPSQADLKPLGSPNPPHGTSGVPTLAPSDHHLRKSKARVGIFILGSSPRTRPEKGEGYTKRTVIHNTGTCRGDSGTIVLS